MTTRLEGSSGVLSVTSGPIEAGPARYDVVVIVNPPSPPGYVANRDSMGGFGQLYPLGATLLPPLDVPYLAGFLQQNGVPLEVLEAQGLGLDLDAVAQRVLAIDSGLGRPLVAVRTSVPTLDWDLSVCAAIKRASPNAGVAIFGPVVPQVLQRLRREESLDYIVLGEPDDVVHELATGHDEAAILGLARRVGAGWSDAQVRPFSKDLDRLPMPAWELLPYERYTLPKSSSTAPVPFLPMLTSRGCPFGCHYCPYPVGQGLPWRFRSPDNVVDEIEHLVTHLGIRYILFRDPMFSMRLGRVQEICEEIQRRGLQFRWKCETRPDCLDEKTLRAMAAAGCDGINFGVESSEMQIQENVGRKPISQEKILEMVALCKRVGVKTFCFFIIGLPGDTVETVLDTIEFAVRLQPNWVQFTAASPFVGTKLREWAIDQALVTEDENAYISSHEAVIGNENLTVEQVESLLHYAQFFERYLINRGGVLKDTSRSGRAYGFAQAAADRAGHASARVALAFGRRRLRRHVAAAGAGQAGRR